MTKLQQIERILRKSKSDNGETMRTLALTDHQWAALLAAVSFWKQEVRKNADDCGIGIHEPCGLEGVERIETQLEESLGHVLEAQ